MKTTTTEKTVVANESLTTKRAKLAYVAMFVGVLGLAVTGIFTFLFGKPPMTGWVLMAHVGMAPVFAIGLACVALTWAAYSRYDNEVSPQSCFSKSLFWIVLVAGLTVILTGVIPMTPFFGTSGQHFLYQAHRYSGIVLAAAVAFHLFSVTRKRS